MTQRKERNRVMKYTNVEREKILETRKSLNLERLDTGLAGYQTFCFSLAARLEQVGNLEECLELKRDWASARKGITRLKKEVFDFNQYVNMVNNFNSQILIANEPLTIKPIFFTEEEVNILRETGVMYNIPFNEKKIYEYLASPAIKKIIYTHMIAVLEAEEVLDLISMNQISKETILSLPLEATYQETSVAPELRQDATKAYAAHLREVYKHLGFEIPETIFKDEQVKGVTFDGRSEKIFTMLKLLSEKLGVTAEKYGVDTFSAESNPNNFISLKLERCVYHNEKENVDEPAIRVLANVRGIKNYRNIEIGYLSKDLALMIEQNHKDAYLSCSLEEVGTFVTDGKPTPYVRIRLGITDAPKALEKEKDSMEDLNLLLDEELR